jgi:hypothetical protein
MVEIRTSTRGVADIVFLIDATGSMMPCIRAVRESVAAFVDGIQQLGATGSPLVRDWRARVVGYRDRPDCEDDWLVEFPFVQSVEQLKVQLSDLSAHGGGTEPESLLDALYHLASLPPEDPSVVTGARGWRPRREAHRFIVVFTDATFHPTFRRSTSSSASDGQLEDVVERVHESGIWLHIFAPEFECYRPLSEIDRCKWKRIPLKVVDDPEFHFGAIGAYALKQFVKDKAQFDLVLRQLGGSISQSTNTEH